MIEKMFEKIQELRTECGVPKGFNQKAECTPQWKSSAEKRFDIS